MPFGEERENPVRIIWLTGNTGAGKTTAMNKLVDMIALSGKGMKVATIDGDDVRDFHKESGMPLGFSKKERWANAISIYQQAHVIRQVGIADMVLVASICPYRDLREFLRKEGEVEFIYVEGGKPNTEVTPYEVPDKLEEFVFTIKGVSHEGIFH